MQNVSAKIKQKIADKCADDLIKVSIRDSVKLLDIERLFLQSQVVESLEKPQVLVNVVNTNNKNNTTLATSASPSTATTASPITIAATSAERLPETNEAIIALTRLRESFNNLSEVDICAIAKVLDWSILLKLAASKSAIDGNDILSKYREMLTYNRYLGFSDKVAADLKTTLDSSKKFFTADQLINYINTLSAYLYIMSCSNTFNSLLQQARNKSLANLRFQCEDDYMILDKVIQTEFYFLAPPLWFKQLIELWKITTERGWICGRAFNMEGQLYHTITNNWLLKSPNATSRQLVKKESISNYAIDLPIIMNFSMNVFSILAYKPIKPNYKKVHWFSDGQLLIEFAMAAANRRELCHVLETNNTLDDFYRNSFTTLVSYVDKAVKLLLNSFQKEYRFLTPSAKDGNVRLIYKYADYDTDGKDKQSRTNINVPAEILAILRHFVIPDVDVYHLDKIRNSTGLNGEKPVYQDDALYSKTSLGNLLNFDERMKGIIKKFRHPSLEMTRHTDFAQHPLVCEIYQKLMLPALCIKQLNSQSMESEDWVPISSENYLNAVLNVQSNRTCFINSSFFAFPGLALSCELFNDSASGGSDQEPNHLLTGPNPVGFYKNRKDRVLFTNLFGSMCHLFKPLKQANTGYSSGNSNTFQMDGENSVRSLSEKEIETFMATHVNEINTVSTSITNILAFFITHKTIIKNLRKQDSFNSQNSIQRQFITRDTTNCDTFDILSANLTENIYNVCQNPIVFDIYKVIGANIQPIKMTMQQSCYPDCNNVQSAAAAVAQQQSVPSLLAAALSQENSSTFM